MKNRSPVAVILLALVSSIASGPAAAQQTTQPDLSPRKIPRLEDLAGDWQDASAVLSLPALNSTQGSAKAARDVVALTDLSFPPITMFGDTGNLQVDRKSPNLEQVRWYPYQVARKGAAGSIGIESAVRLMNKERQILFRLVLTNHGSARQTFDLTINLSATTSRHTHWGWGVPRDNDPARYSTQIADNGQSLLLRDSRGELGNCFSFERKPDKLSASGNTGLAAWQITLAPNETSTVNYVLGFGEQGDAVHDLAIASAKTFSNAFDQVQTDWQALFDAMFTPGNSVFSGSLPVLVTADEKLARIYWMGALTALNAYRTNFPICPRVYISNSPEANCTMMYFWDTREWATTLALLDPAMLKQDLRSWLTQGIQNGYAEEFLTGTLQGPWYSANELSIFILLDSYLNVTGDRAFLAETISGKTILEHMDAIATRWQQLVRPGRTLADYGKAGNLLECVPTYINEVASLNAANIWMMRRVAAIEEAHANKPRADELRADAEQLFKAVLELYEPGQGVWNALHRDGTKVQIRHVFDFATIGLTLKKELPPEMRKEMTAFVERELLTDHWMRAQSFSDQAASKSDRPDHGPMGAFSAWPAETIATFCEFGEYGKASDFLHRCASVTQEGPFSQSRELLGKTPDAQVRIASRGGRNGHQCYNASNGASFAETIIREFFGYQPDLLSDKLIPNPQPRGFEGRLLNVRCGDRSVDISSTPSGLEVSPAEITTPH